ncbi:transposase [Corynebacterium maris]|uniref:transposase n=1 Tax=Corynebacterium maris TaxID=575200 RepID=UPI000A0274B9
MVGCGELTDKAWGRIASLLPDKPGGRRWSDHRQMINAIVWKLALPVPECVVGAE